MTGSSLLPAAGDDNRLNGERSFSSAFRIAAAFSIIYACLSRETSSPASCRFLRSENADRSRNPGNPRISGRPCPGPAVKRIDMFSIVPEYQIAFAEGAAGYELDRVDCAGIVLHDSDQFFILGPVRPSSRSAAFATRYPSASPGQRWPWNWITPADRR